MTTLLLASLLVVKFPGGSPNEFVSLLSEATNQNVVLSQGQAQTINAAEFETKDLDEMARAIRAQIQHVIMPGTELVLTTQRLHPELVSAVMFRGAVSGAEGLVIAAIPLLSASGSGSTRAANYQVNLIGMPVNALKDGKFTIKTEKQDALQLTSFQGFGSKPIQVHWIFRETPIFMNVKDLPELEMLRWAAKAVGAKLTQNTKEFHFEVDPLEIRKRAVAAILFEEEQVRPFQIRPDEGNEMSRVRRPASSFRISVLNALSAFQITKALETSGGNVTIELGPRGPLTALALQRIRALEQSQLSLPASSPAPRTAVGLLQRVDPNRIPTMTVDSKFSVRMDIPVVDANGRPAGSVRL